MEKEKNEHDWLKCKDTDVAVIAGIESVAESYADSPYEVSADMLMEDIWATPTATEVLRVLEVAFKMAPDNGCLQWGQKIYTEKIIRREISLTHSEGMLLIKLLNGKSPHFHTYVPSEEKRCMVNSTHLLVDMVRKLRLNVKGEGPRDLAPYRIEQDAELEVNDGSFT
jgi:hypothetical protein